MRLSLILAGIWLACCSSAAADTGTGSFDDGTDGTPLVAPGGFYTAGKYIYNAKREKHLFRGVRRRMSECSSYTTPFENSAHTA